MKKTSLLFLLIAAVFTMSLPACAVKSGCPTKDYTNRMDTKKTKRGKSNLFDKSTRKRM
jgi:hypothetical protein